MIKTVSWQHSFRCLRECRAMGHPIAKTCRLNYIRWNIKATNKSHSFVITFKYNWIFARRNTQSQSLPSKSSLKTVTGYCMSFDKRERMNRIQTHLSSAIQRCLNHVQKCICRLSFCLAFWMWRIHFNQVLFIVPGWLPHTHIVPLGV